MMRLAGEATPMEKLQQVAFLSVGRAVGFAGLAIFTLMVGLCFEPLLALRSGGVLLLLLVAVLLLKAYRVEATDYRHTEAWLLLDSSDRPDESIAARAVRVALRDAFLWFARWTAGVAALVWGSAVLVW
ncbi:MAG TPA: hypothetical protein VHG92_06695, partial [Afifellaceae bacterium]|nr:hypothetical protein [Afifellaceae bacterium]